MAVTLKKRFEHGTLKFEPGFYENLYGHECEECRKQFVSYSPNSRFCSRICYGKSFSLKEAKWCEHCRKLIMMHRHEARKEKHFFCSQNCWHEFQKATKAVCHSCHHAFTSNMKKLHEKWCNMVKKLQRKAVESAKMLHLVSYLNRDPNGFEALGYVREARGVSFDPGEEFPDGWKIEKAYLPDIYD